MEELKVTHSADWKELFKPEDTSWLDALQNDKSRPVKTVLLDIVTEFIGCEIAVARVEEHGEWMDRGRGYECKHTRDLCSPVIASRKDALQIIDENGHDYCCVPLEEFENLIFKRLGSVDNIAAYVIYFDNGNVPTKIELMVEHEPELK